MTWLASKVALRGADVAFYSYARLPKGDLPPGYGPEAPELVVEVANTGRVSRTTGVGGHGLIGIQERVGVAGGSVDAGP